MKITTNMIGNYSPQMISNPVKHAKQSGMEGKIENKPAVKTQQNSLTSDEKNFFMDLYPQNKSEIIDYHFYQRSGKMSGVKVGSLFDKRG